jgi:hypothetical protein
VHALSSQNLLQGLAMSHDLDRREFGRLLAAGLAAGGASTTVAMAQDAPPRKTPLAVLVLARILDEFPSERYDEAALEGILADIRSDLARSRDLSAFPLQNGDEPAFVFPGSPRLRVSPRLPETR